MLTPPYEQEDNFNLEQAMNNNPSDEKKLSKEGDSKCDYCDENRVLPGHIKKCSQKYSDYMKTVYGSSLYDCLICSSKGIQKQKVTEIQMVKHLNEIHPYIRSLPNVFRVNDTYGIPWFQCEICSFKSITKEDALLHVDDGIVIC